VKRAWLWLLKNTLNRLTVRLARSGRGPFALIRHVGRKTGRQYETPLLLARLDDAFVAELTYGPDVAWYRNVVAAGRCEVLLHGVVHRIDRIGPCAPDAGLRAFGFPAAAVLRLLNRREFRLLHRAT
jgi:F420H(2)-dependent quinone reductase